MGCPCKVLLASLVGLDSPAIQVTASLPADLVCWDFPITMVAPALLDHLASLVWQDFPGILVTPALQVSQQLTYLRLHRPSWDGS